MPIHKLHSSFNAGELSPLMDSRVNVEKYEAGCRKLRNFILHTHGPVFRRPGLEHMGAAGSDAAASRLIEFNFSATTTFAIEMVAGGVFRFWSNGLLVRRPGVEPLAERPALEVWHPYAADELFEVQVKQVNDVCYFAHRNHHPLKLVRLADDRWTSEHVPFRYPPLLDEYVEKESVATPTVTEIYSAALEEAAEVTFSARTAGTIPTFVAPAQAGHDTAWFTVGWTWPSSPATTGAPTRTLGLEVYRSRDSMWVPITSAVTLSTTGTPPSGYQFKFRADGTDNLLVDRKVGDGPWALLGTLADFFATTMAAGTLPSLTLRWVYGPATTNDLGGHAVVVSGIHGGPHTTPFTHVVRDVASRDITTTWRLPATVPASRTLSWQVLNGSGNWVQVYAWGITTALDDAPGTFRLRYTAGTTLALEEKHANGYWTQRGTAAMAAGTSWRLRWLYGPESTVQGISAATVVGCGTSNASTTVRMASTAGRSVGEAVTGAGIPAGAVVAAIVNSTNLTLSVAATASAADHTAGLTFTRDARVTLSDGAVTHTAVCGRCESGVGDDAGKGGITVPAGQWQARVVVPGGQTLPEGATVSLQRWTGSGWTGSGLRAAWTIAAGGTYEYTAQTSGAFTVPTMVRLLYKGGTSLRRCLGTASVETITYPNAKGTTLAVDGVIGQGRTMLARDLDGDEVELFKQAHEGSTWQIAHRRELSYAELQTTGSGTSTEIRVSGRWDLFTYGTWHGTLHLERKSASNVWQIVRSWTSKGDRNVTATGTEEQDSDLRLRMVHTAGGTSPRFVLEAADSRTYGLVKVVEYVGPSEVRVDVVRVLAATTATSLWAEGAWSDERGFPAAVGLHEGRLWFGGSKHQPQTLWASVSNDFENFRRSTLDDGAMVVTLAAESCNSIRWLSSTSALLIGTGGEEWALRSSQEGVAITPTSLRVERQSGYSSMPLGARIAHEVTVFVQRDGRRIRQLSYTDAQQSYTAADLTVLAPHVTFGGVRQIAFQQAPTAILWVVTKDGRLAGMTFEREQNVFGWHVHDTDGEIESVAVLHGTPADEVWVAVKRELGGQVRRYIERMQPRAMASDWTEPGQLVYLDSAKAYDFDPRGVSADEGTWARDALEVGGGALRPLEAVVTAGLTLPQTAFVRMVTAEGVQMPSRWVLQAGGSEHEPEEGIVRPLDFNAVSNARVWVRQEGMTLTGLGHLEGRTVSVLADGLVHSSRVVTGGAVTLDFVALRVVVGLPYTSELQPMKQEVQMPDGTAQGRRFKLHGVTVRVDHSLGGEVNANPEDATLPWSRMPGAIVLGNATPLYTGERDMILESRHEAAVNLTVRQQEPLPLNITALILKFDVYGD